MPPISYETIIFGLLNGGVVESCLVVPGRENQTLKSPFYYIKWPLWLTLLCRVVKWKFLNLDLTHKEQDTKIFSFKTDLLYIWSFQKCKKNFSFPVPPYTAIDHCALCHVANGHLFPLPRDKHYNEVGERISVFFITKLNMLFWLLQFFLKNCTPQNISVHRIIWLIIRRRRVLITHNTAYPIRSKASCKNARMNTIVICNGLPDICQWAIFQSYQISHQVFKNWSFYLKKKQIADMMSTNSWLLKKYGKCLAATWDQYRSSECNK